MVPRVTATLLIVLVGLMAFVPQALCPCAVRARATAAPSTGPAQSGPAAHACCERCVARLQALAALAAGGSAPTDAPVRVPAPCPCCAINGQGKTLLTLDAAVRTAPLAPAGFVVPLPVPLLLAPSVACTAAGEAAVPDDPLGEVAERLTSVVLLI